MEDREAIRDEEREAVRSDDDVEAHSLAVDDKSLLPTDDDEERRVVDPGA